MKAPNRIAIYYGITPNWPERLRGLRARYPEAHITAILPAGYVPGEGELACVDDHIHTARPHYSPRDVRACADLVGSIRSGRYDLFVVTYPTLQLRVLAALSGARRCECWTQENWVIPLTSWPLWVGPSNAGRYAAGLLRVARAWAWVALAPVRGAAPRTGPPPPAQKE